MVAPWPRFGTDLAQPHHCFAQGWAGLGENRGFIPASAQPMKLSVSDLLPIAVWGRGYGRRELLADGTAAAVVTLLLIPQSLALALLAGMPAETGLYASMAPVLLYALFGSSRVMAVGPTAITSLMTATAIGGLAASGSVGYAAAAGLLALLSGLMLFAMGLARLGFLANFLSHSVLVGFVSAAGLLIAASQLKYLLGLPLASGSFLDTLVGLWRLWPQVHGLTSAMGLGALALLWGLRRYLKSALVGWGMALSVADLLGKAAPLLVLLLCIALTRGLALDQQGLAVVGVVPSGLPAFSLPLLEGGWWAQLQPLWLAALLIGLVGFVESVSIGQSLAAKRRERIEPDAELRALGAANVAAGLSGGFAVTGSFSRSAVNAEAGAQTPAAGVFTAIALALTAVFFTPALYHLPQAVLAATIVVAVLGLVDGSAFVRTWRYSRADFSALLLTFGLTLGVGVELGLVVGVVGSLLLHVWRTSRPHIATVGRVPGTEHFRNVLRHRVLTQPDVLSLRVDESLYFANARFLEDHVAAQVAANPALRHVILVCTAINAIDASALESLEAISQRLRDADVSLHLSEVKGPVMDRLLRSDFLLQLSGRVFLTQHQAVTALGLPADAQAVPLPPAPGTPA